MFQSICSETLTIVMAPAQNAVTFIAEVGAIVNQRLACSEVDISFPPRSIQLLPRDGSNITSFLEVLYGETNLKT